MDTAVDMGSVRTGGVRPGRIIIVRHGRPALDREAGPKLDWRAYRAWWARYEAGSLAEGQSVPQGLKSIISKEALIFSSIRPRARETAMLLSSGNEISHVEIFNEAPLPPPRWSDKRKYLPKTWNKIARLAWLLGHHGGEEHVEQTRRRAAEAASLLADAASDGRDVVLAAHGWFNRMLRRPLVKAGWRCTRDGGDAYWSFRVYEKT
jgi:broad specificity phosphatase PhoE